MIQDRRSNLGSRAGGLLAVVVATLGAPSCGTPADVSLSVSADHLTLTKSTGPFGPKLAGGVDVEFDLGHYTGDPVKVETIGLRLFQGTTKVNVLARAQLVADSTGALPFTLAPGTSKTVHYTIGIDQLQPTEVTELCAGPISASGAVESDGRAPVEILAAAVTATGCP